MTAATAIFVEQRQTKFWTKSGLKSLGKAIREAREEKGWSMDHVVDLIQHKTGHALSKSTLSAIERASASRNPEFNTLAAIAAAEFVLDPSGKPLTVFDFCNIAAEELDPFKHLTPALKKVNQSHFLQMIRQCAEANNLSFQDIEELFLENREALTDMRIERFQAILKGATPTEDELRVLRAILDPYEEIFSEADWLDVVFGKENPPCHCCGERDGHAVNGFS